MQNLSLMVFLVSCSQSKDSSIIQSKPTYLLGNVTLTGTDELLIDGKNILINGNVTIKDAAKLTMKNSDLGFSQSYSQQYRLEARNSSQLIIDNVNMQNQSTWMNWGFYDTALISQSNFIHNANLWQEVHGSNVITLTGSSVSMTFMPTSYAQLTAHQSDMVWLELGLTSDGSPYSLTLPNGQSNADWSAPTSLPYDITITDSDIHSIDFDVVDGVDVTVNNSDGVRFGWIFGIGSSSNGGYSDTISGLKNQHYTDQTFSAGSGIRSSSVRFVNSTLINWWPTTWTNHSLTLSDCTLADPRAWNNSTVTISNSTMTMFGAYNSASVSISNSSITSFIIAKDTSSMNLSNVTFNGSVTKDSGASILRNGVSYP